MEQTSVVEVEQLARADPAAPLNPWLTIWIWPRKTIREIVDADPGYRVTLLAMLAGFAQALSEATSENMGDTLSLPIIFLLCAILGPIGGLISLYVMAGLWRLTGSWLGGKASSQEVRAAIAWSSVPVIWAMLLWIPYLAIFREEMFTSAMPRTESSLLLLLLLLGFGLVEIVIGLWRIVVLLQCLGEVHRFSAWRALGAFILGPLLIALPLLGLILLVAFLAP
jgi:hypothetical protein